MATAAQFHSARSLAKAAELSAKTIHRLARRENWRRRQIGNRYEYVAPRRLLGGRQLPKETARAVFPPSIPSPERYRLRRAWLRFEALTELRLMTESGTPVEQALADVARGHTFHVSPSSLRQWAARLASRGVAGLGEDKLGRVGRKAARDHRRMK